MGLFERITRRPQRYRALDVTTGQVVASGSLQQVVAAASPVDMARKQITPGDSGWQEEAWKFYDELGEFRYGVDWRAEMISRVRLRVGKVIPGQDEPELLESGPEVDLLKKLTDGAAGGVEQLMKGFATQLSVPGELWFTGEIVDPRTEIWRARSAAEIRKARNARDGTKWEVLDDVNSYGDNETWRTFPTDGIVTRVWEPHPRKFYRADSPARAARPVMRELELVNRKIQAQYLSRLASAGVILIPEEIDFPVNPLYANHHNPFVQEWIDTAKTAIQTPGTAAATIPIPMRGAAEFLDKIRFIDFSISDDAQILEKRDSAIRRLATQLDLPAEVLLGMGDVNHWSAWQLEESGVKVHILPMVERICNAVYTGFLEPRMKVEGLDSTDRVIWYDASEITMRPDRSEAAVVLYDKLEINGTALRRETGLDESDVPTDEELERMVLLRMAAEPSTAATALKELTGLELEPVASTPQPEVVEDPQASPEATGTSEGPPDTQNAPPPAPDEAARAASGMVTELRSTVLELRAQQAQMRHWFVKDITGFKITHPDSCTGLPVKCPYESEIPPASVPGRSGTYEIDLVNGRLRVGPMRQDSAYAHHRT